MPLYLVRWPGMSASLVSARNEEDLLDTLDQVDDSEGASWAVYRGPVWIDFDVPARYRIDEKVPDEPLRPDEIVVEDVEKVEMGTFALSSPGCDHTSDMHERITRRAFPKLYRALYGREEEPTEDELKKAVHAELQQLVSADWRKAARGKRTDLIGQIAQQMRAPVQQIENILRRSGDLEPSVPPPRADVRTLATKKKPNKRGRSRKRT
jgi:hypothetical protein